jgi:hypothetical protein
MANSSDTHKFETFKHGIDSFLDSFADSSATFSVRKMWLMVSTDGYTETPVMASFDREKVENRCDGGYRRMYYVSALVPDCREDGQPYVVLAGILGRLEKVPVDSTFAEMKQKVLDKLTPQERALLKI